MNMRDWLAIIILVGIVVILVDGYRRRSRVRNNIRMKLDRSIPPAADDDHSSELPSGGARVRPRGNSQEAALDVGDEPLSPSFDDEEDNSRYDQAYPDYDDEAADDEDSERHDVLLSGYAQDDASGDDDDSGEAFAPEDEHDAGGEEDLPDREDDFNLDDNDGRREPAFGDLDEDPEAFSISADVDDAPRRSRRNEKPLRSKSRRKIPSQVFQNELPLDDDDPGMDDDDDFGDDADEASPVEEVIVINVMARPGNLFPGSELLPILKHQGLRLGSMSIFHRHADARGNGPVMFSMANMVKPGTFDMATMDTFSTPGVSLFMQMPSSLGHMQCFDTMLTAANAIKDALDGELKDEQRSVLTRQTIEHCRQRIRDFELSQLSRNR